MLYRNEKTGAVIDVRSELGGAWKPVEEKTAEEPKKEVKQKKAKKGGK